MAKCPCGSNSIEHDSAAGNSYCTNCGQVLEENTIVSEITFGETGSGGAMVQGAFLKGNQTRISGNSLNKRFNRMESREQSIANGRRHIQMIAVGLKLSERYIEAAQRYFNLAIAINFIQGRKAQHVACACVYIVCRNEKTSHMLIDFSDVLQTNVFKLGSVFLRLIKELHLILPIVDPSLYISRFASMLDFGEKTHSVAATATRLVQRMNRDWLHVGRRPSGICGACLIIAGRMHGFQRSKIDVVQIVKIGEMTIHKRLMEFSETPSSRLTFEEFNTVWLEEECDPPAFTKSRKAKAEENVDTEAGMEEAIENLEREVEETIENELNEFLVSKELEKLANDLKESVKETIEGSTCDGLSDVDDDEIENYLLTKEEAEMKEKIWNEVHKEYLEELRVKKQKDEISKKYGVEADAPKKKRRKKKEIGRMKSVADAAVHILSSKSVSKKLNYAAIDEMFNEDLAEFA